MTELNVLESAIALDHSLYWVESMLLVGSGRPSTVEVWAAERRMRVFRVLFTQLDRELAEAEAS